MNRTVSRNHPAWLLLSWVCYAAVSPWGVRTAAGWRDGPEFIVSSQVLGIAHPSGFPLYSAWGWFVQQLLPVGDLTMRNHLSNTILTLAAAIMLYSLASAFFRLFRLDMAQATGPHLAGFISLIWLLMPPQWENAIQAEVYSMLALFTFGVLRLLIAYWESADPRLYLMAVFLVGLGCGAHITSGFLIFTFVTFLAAAPGIADALRLALKAVVAGIAGLAVYAYLPVRSLRNPVMDWGDTERWIGFLHHVTDHKDSASRFDQLLLPHADTPNNIVQLCLNISDWVGPVLLLLAIVGWGVLLYRGFWPCFGILLWLCFAFIFFSGWISGTVLTACLGVLLFGLAPWVEEALRWRRSVALAIIFLVAGSGLGYAANAGTNFLAARSDRLPRAVVAEEMLALPYRATLLVGTSWFHVSALANVEGMRPDVSILPLGDLISPQIFKPIRFSDIPLIKPVPIRFSQFMTPTGEDLLDFLEHLRRVNADRTRFFIDPDDGRNLRLFYPHLHPYKRLWLRWDPASAVESCDIWQRAIFAAMQTVFSEDNALRDWETSDYFVAPYFGHVSALIEEPPGCPRTAIGLIGWWQHWMQRNTVMQGALLNDLGMVFSMMGKDQAARVMFQLGANINRPEAMGNLGLWFARKGRVEQARKWLSKAFEHGLDEDYGKLRALSHRQAGK